MQKPIVTIIGHTCIDHNTIDGVRYESWGSSAMYIAKYFAKEFDVKSHIVSSYGHDFMKYATEFNFIGEPSSENTLLYENIVNNGDRTQFCKHSNFSPPVKVEGEVANLLSQTDILIIAPMLANYSVEYIDQIMEYLPEKTLKVLLPQGYMRHINSENKIEKKEFTEAKHILKYFDVVVASDEDYDNALEVAKDWAKHKDGSSIVITQAEKGATVFHEGQSTQISTTPIPFNEIKNPVGSGDMFSAQFTMSLHNRLHPHEAVRQANEATARALLSNPLQ
jgi:Sugar kinases, ribokinase family